MEFNYLLENRALTHAGGRYSINYSRMPGVLAQLAQKLPAFEAAGDRAGVEAWFAKYGKLPPELSKVLAAVGDIPVDIDPVFSFRDEVQ